MPINDGGSAFPATEANYHNENMRGEGMSLRDYFAAQALPGLINALADKDHNDLQVRYCMSMAQQYASEAYEIADAMLAARSA